MRIISSIMLISLMFSGNVKANRQEEFETSLNGWQKSYPVLRLLRKEPDFKATSTRMLEQQPSLSAKDVLNLSIQDVIESYIRRMRSPFYYTLVEALDPVFRALNPDCGTNGNRRPVHHIFSGTGTADASNTKSHK